MGLWWGTLPDLMAGILLGLHGVTLVEIRDLLSKLIHLVHSEPGTVPGPVDTRNRETGLLPGGSSDPGHPDTPTIG